MEYRCEEREQMEQSKKREWILPKDCECKRDCEHKGEGGHPAENPLIAQILSRRGICTEEARAEFLSDRPQETYDPFLLKDMKAAVELICTAVSKGERICIYGDYDADGVTACSLLLTILGKLTENLTYYIPSRFDEGYGLNEDAIRSIAEDGVNLLVTVDCGSVSYREVELAKELGLVVVVTDHHSINGAQAADCILINPKQEECPYPFKELAGCGVAFKLAQALQRKLEERGDLRIKKADITENLDLVAIATIGDIVPLVSENRSLVKYGLNILNQGRRLGLRALIDGVGLVCGKIRAEQIAYIIVPHLNAAGRMISAKKGVELLTASGGSDEAVLERKKAVVFLVENNKERKRVQEETFQQCRLLMEQTHPEDLFQIIYAEDAHEGIAGIVAGKLKDVLYRPVIIVTPSGDGCIKGTGRSVEGVNLYELLSTQRDLFQRFGGHSGACGFLMDMENLEALRAGLNKNMEQLVQDEPELLTERICIDSVAEAGDLTIPFLKEAEKLGPFGHKNPEPLFALRDVRIKRVAYMGDRGQHVRFQLAGSDGREVGCVLFQHAADYSEILEEGKKIDAAGYPGINVWNGMEKIQFVIRDLK